MAGSYSDSREGILFIQALRRLTKKMNSKQSERSKRNVKPSPRTEAVAAIVRKCVSDCTLPVPADTKGRDD